MNLVLLAGAAYAACMHDPLFRLRVPVLDRLHKPAAGSGSIAGINVNMLAPEALRAVVGKSRPADKSAAVFAPKALYHLPEHTCPSYDLGRIVQGLCTAPFTTCECGCLIEGDSSLYQTTPSSMTQNNELREILLVDDEDFVCDMYTFKFKKEGIDVSVAYSGNEMLEMLRTKKECPDVILLDVIMPEMDGLEALEKAYKEGLTENSVVIMLTNQGGEDVYEKARSLGAQGHIVKSSYTPSRIVEETKRIYSENRQKRG